jgi:hypothetical protein
LNFGPTAGQGRLQYLHNAWTARLGLAFANDAFNLFGKRVPVDNVALLKYPFCC